MLLSLLGTAVSGPPVGASPVGADRNALLIASQKVLQREHAHAVRFCFAKGAALFPELTERQVDALALAPPSFLKPLSGIAVPLPLWLPTLVTVSTAAPDASQAATDDAALIYEVVEQPAGPVRPFTATRYDPESARGAAHPAQAPRHATLHPTLRPTPHSTPRQVRRRHASPLGARCRCSGPLARRDRRPPRGLQRRGGWLRRGRHG